MKLFKHIKKWNQWRKKNQNGKLHHILVLFGVIKAPSFNVFMTQEECDEIMNKVMCQLHNSQE